MKKRKFYKIGYIISLSQILGSLRKLSGSYVNSKGIWIMGSGKMASRRTWMSALGKVREEGDK
jgi:hypothetical protein